MSVQIGISTAPPGFYSISEPGRTLGFNVAPLAARWAETIPRLIRGELPMPVFGSAGASLSGGWSDVASQGLSVLGSWASAKAQRKALKQQTKLLRMLGGAQLTPPLSPVVNAANPFASVTPNIGSTASFAQSLNLPSTSVWDLPTLPQAAEGVFDTIGESAVSAWDTLFGGAQPVATTAVATRRASPPRIVGAIDNASGKSFFYRYVGAPILFRGDLQTLKTARKAVSKFGGVTRKGCGPFRRRR